MICKWWVAPQGPILKYEFFIMQNSNSISVKCNGNSNLFYSMSKGGGGVQVFIIAPLTQILRVHFRDMHSACDP